MTNSPEPSGFLPERSSSRGAWRWQLLDATGADVSDRVDLPGPPPRFAAQGDAETWVGEAWRDLVASGVDAVTLLEGDRVVYGPMSLHA